MQRRDMGYMGRRMLRMEPPGRRKRKAKEEVYGCALETRELDQKKDDLTQQIQMYRVNIQEKGKCIEESHKAIKKLEEDIQQKENTVKCCKDIVKRKMFQERIENYWKIFQQHKEEYLRNPLATKLLKIHSENEEIERRIQATEDEIIAKEKALKALQVDKDTCDSSSQSSSQGQKEGRDTPSFVFSMNSGPNTPTFSGFDCNFEVEPSQHEESSFMFSSSYFSKTSPESNLPGFLFDESENRTEEDFAFSFSSKSPQPKSGGSGGAGDAFPFSFSFGKF
ncbi:hypothetical protein C0J50_21823 [Silurus asotus]|uniref:Uncharacterized protein n=1 Tax=Silurus asotus TaxID=30991 RepID=A0AAD5AMT6_SILAS|nr:hypothetical protein C0J50_21823 [Silurus asotus]